MLVKRFNSVYNIIFSCKGKLSLKECRIGIKVNSAANVEQLVMMIGEYE